MPFRTRVPSSKAGLSIRSSGARRLSALSTTVAIALLAGCSDAQPTAPTNGPDALASFGKIAVSGFDLASISAGLDHTCGLDQGGQAYCWGHNLVGELGDGSLVAASYVPIPVAGHESFSAIAAGAYHSCAIDRAGTAFCWGVSNEGETGTGTSASSIVPVTVSGNYSFEAITASATYRSYGEDYTCGLTTSGEALCWGYNGSGQLGDGTTDGALAPVPVQGGFTFSSLSAGAAHTCGILVGSGRAVCWGDNTSGQLGDGTTIQSPVPVEVSGGYSFVDIAAGAHHTCGVEHSGQVLCWGAGALGNGSADPSPDPVALEGGYSFVTVGSGTDFSCGVTSGSKFKKNGGQVLCWDRNPPQVVLGGFKATAISVGDHHVCGITGSAGAWCWGQNDWGQLGIGTAADSPGPVPVDQPGDASGLSTYTQSEWASSLILTQDYDFVYGSTYGQLEIGESGPSYEIIFGSGDAVQKYLPASGTPGALTSDLADPTSTAAGEFGGELTALHLNIDFFHYFFPWEGSSPDPDGAVVSSPMPFGDYTLCNLSDASLNGLTVAELRDLADTWISGANPGVSSIASIDALLPDLNASIDNGEQSTWAQQHLSAGACP